MIDRLEGMQISRVLKGNAKILIWSLALVRNDNEHGLEDHSQWAFNLHFLASADYTSTYATWNLCLLHTHLIYYNWIRKPVRFSKQEIYFSEHTQ
jgi:hypothetical protein